MMPNKRKGRTTANSKPVKSKTYNDRTTSFEGVYGNPRLMHATTSLVGSVVQVQVRTGEIYEGIFTTFSKELELVLETAHKVSLKSLSARGVSPAVSNLLDSFPFDDGAYGKLIFKWNDVVSLKASNIDTDFAIRDNFTDTAISKFNGQVSMERELEPWEGASSDNENLALGGDDDGANGWDANDMFRTNAEKYGVKSSYDNSLHEYTVPLTKKDTDEYKMKEAQASKIAGEIEKNNSYQERIQLENGDEEDRFSAVVRPENTSSKYVLPQKRRNIPGPKRQNSTTSLSPVHATGSKPYTTSHMSPNALPSSGHINKQYVHSHPTESKPSSPPFQNSPTASMSLPPVPKDIEKAMNGEGTMGKEMIKSTSISTALENAPLMSGPPHKSHNMCPPSSQTLPPRIERRRENEKKLMKQQKGRTDEIAEFRKFSTNFKLNEENKESCESRDEFTSSENKSEQVLCNKLSEQVKIDKDPEEKTTDISKSTLNPNAKEFVFNPNAKSFTPRSMSVSSPHTPIPVQPQRMQAQSPVIAVPHSQIIPGLPQPIFTAMTPQYVMQAAPVSMALTAPFGAASLSQAPRFRKVPITMQPRHEITPSMHVAAATGQPILAPAAMPTPSQLTMQYTNAPRVIHASGPPQQAMGYPQMNFVVGPSRVVPQQQVGVVPTSHSVSYCDTSQIPTHHLLMSAHPGAHSLQQGVSGQHSNHHPPQSQTPGVHPSPSPVHQVPTPHGNHSQPPTPTTVMYPGGAMGQHPLQSVAHHNHTQQLSHPLHQAHHPGYPSGPQPVVLMQQQQQPAPPTHHGHQPGAAHHALHMHTLHSQNPGNHMGNPAHILPQMTIIPTSAAMPTTISTPPYVQHPQGV